MFDFIMYALKIIVSFGVALLFVGLIYCITNTQEKVSKIYKHLKLDEKDD